MKMKVGKVLAKNIQKACVNDIVLKGCKLYRVTANGYKDGEYWIKTEPIEKWLKRLESDYNATIHKYMKLNSESQEKLNGATLHDYKYALEKVDALESRLYAASEHIDALSDLFPKCDY